MWIHNKKRRHGALFVVIVAGLAASLLWSNRTLLQRSTRLWRPNLSDMVANRWPTDTARWGAGQRQLVIASTGELSGRVLLKSDDAPGLRGVPITAPDSVRSLLGVTPDNQLLALPNPDLRPLPMYVIPLFPATAPVRVSKIPLPANTALVAAVLAPDGKRIAWGMTGESAPLLKRLLGRYIPHFARMEGQTFSRLMVSDADGANLREIGTEAGDPITDLYWRKDGGRICFVYQSIYYSVPAD